MLTLNCWQQLCHAFIDKFTIIGVDDNQSIDLIQDYGLKLYKFLSLEGGVNFGEADMGYQVLNTEVKWVGLWFSYLVVNRGE